MKHDCSLVPALLLLALLLSGCGKHGTVLPAAPEELTEEGPDASAVDLRRLETRYAEGFEIRYLPDGAAELTIAGEERFLVVPPGWEGTAAPGTVLLQKPLTGLYIASTSVMDLITRLDALEAVAFTGSAAESWTLPEIRSAMESGVIRYAGRYSAPDFELLVSENCPLAVENTMLWHSPEIQEKLEALGIPVLVERSSYEPHPLGRLEWIRVYGLLLDREAEAEEFFHRQAAVLEELTVPAAGSVSAAYFSINAAGAAVVRQPGDYVSRLIALAGGRYVFDDLPGDGTARSTVNLQMERFYTGARDADVLFYNSAIEGELETLADLLDKSSLLADFRRCKTEECGASPMTCFRKAPPRRRSSGR